MMTYGYGLGWRKLVFQSTLARFHVVTTYVFSRKNYYKDALQRDTYVRRNLDYLRRNPKYSSTTFQQRGLDAESMDSVLRRLGLLQPDGESELVNNDFVPVASVKTLNRVEMRTLLYALAEKRVVKVTDEFVEVLSMECARRVALWNPRTCILFVDLWLEWRGYLAVHSVFFNVLLKEWANYKPSRTSISDDSTTVPICKSTLLLRPLVQLMYYVGLRKSSYAMLMSKSEKLFEDNIAELDDKELVIVSQGFFKTSTQIVSVTLLGEITRRVKSLLSLSRQPVDQYDLLSLLKVLRHAKFDIGDDLLSELSSCIKSGVLRPPNVVALAHFAATFANSKFYDKNLFCLFEEMFLRELSLEKTEAYRPLQGRNLKDTARILWTLSSLTHQTSNPEFPDKIVGHLRQWVTSNNTLQLNGKRRFVDCLQSLILMQIFPSDLLELALSSQFFNELNVLNKRKPLHQLSFIAESINIEASDVIADVAGKCLLTSDGDFSSDGIFPGADMFGELQRRPALDAVRLAVHQMCDGNMDLYRCTHLLNHISIAGFEMSLDDKGDFCELQSKTSCRVAIEVLDETVCLRASADPDGLMTTKIRQLRKLGFRVIHIGSDSLRQFTDLSVSHQIEFLRDCIGNRGS